MDKDMAQRSANSNGKTSIITEKPYETPLNSGRRRRYKPDPTLVHFDHIFGSNNWSQFLVLKTEERITSSVLENKLLSICPTREMSFRAQKENEWLVEVTTKVQSNFFLDIKEINGIKVTVESHEMLNYIQGTVVLPQIEDETELPEKNLLLESLKLRYNNVHDLEVYKIPSRKNPNNVISIAKI